MNSHNTTVLLHQLILLAEVCLYYNKLHKKTFLHKFLVSLVLLAMMLKYSRFKLYIPVQHLILNNLRVKNESIKFDIA